MDWNTNRATACGCLQSLIPNDPIADSNRIVDGVSRFLLSGNNENTANKNRYLSETTRNGDGAASNRPKRPYRLPVLPMDTAASQPSRPSPLICKNALMNLLDVGRKKFNKDRIGELDDPPLHGRQFVQRSWETVEIPPRHQTPEGQALRPRADRR